MSNNYTIPASEMWATLAKFEFRKDPITGSAEHKSRGFYICAETHISGDEFNLSGFIEEAFGDCFMIGRKDGYNEGADKERRRITNKIHEAFGL